MDKPWTQANGRTPTVLLIFAASTEMQALKVVERLDARTSATLGAARAVRQLTIRKATESPSLTYRLRTGETFTSRAQGVPFVDGGSLTFERQVPGDSSMVFYLSKAPSNANEAPSGFWISWEHRLSNLTLDESARILEAADEMCGYGNLVYGQVGESIGGKTPLMRSSPNRLGPDQAWRRECLLGYDWVTYIPPSLAKRISKARLELAKDSLDSLSLIDNGILKMRSTVLPAEFGPEARMRLFSALVDVLPDGVPDPAELDLLYRGYSRSIIVFENPQSFR